MRPSRRSQPYRKGSARRQGKAFDAMMRGRDAFGRNPADRKRARQKAVRRRT